MAFVRVEFASDSSNDSDNTKVGIVSNMMIYRTRKMNSNLLLDLIYLLFTVREATFGSILSYYFIYFYFKYFYYKIFVIFIILNEIPIQSINSKHNNTNLISNQLIQPANNRLCKEILRMK